MRNRKRRKAKHRCQKATKQVKGQTDGRGDQELYALNIQMFIDASVRNGFDTLKTSLKFFLFKIYTWVRRLSGAVRAAAVQCGVSVTSSSPEVLLVHKSNVTRFPRAERLSSPASSSSSWTVGKVPHRSVSGPWSSQVWPALIISLWGQKHPRNALRCFSHLSNIQRSCGPGSLSVSPSFHFPFSSVQSSFIQFLIGTFLMKFIFY